MTPSGQRVHLIACGVLAVDIKALAKRLGLDASLEFLPGGLHRHPHALRERLQSAIDAASARADVDAIAIGYGVCGTGAVGLRARNIPLRLPRVHDCIALFLGSDAAYREQFGRFPGTYYVSAGWIEEGTEPPDAGQDRAGANGDIDLDAVESAFGTENRRAVEHFMTSWQRNYQRAAFIDTGTGRHEKYADIARKMARTFGWRYESLAGSHALLETLLKTSETTPEILVVPPRMATVYDPLARRLNAAPASAGQADDTQTGSARTVAVGAGDASCRPGAARLGLGIDAGGTYTDVAVYDFRADAVLRKSKALTTRWDFTVGIDEALNALEPALLERIDLVAVSTTLATNAVVEGRGQPVGLLLMPPYGRIGPSRFRHQPLAVIRGQLEIDGREIEPVDPDQVRSTVRAMRERGLAAFAVAGYASHVNPLHEQQVREAIRGVTGCHVTCGHEISRGLNYRIQAETAALNARIIPCLAALLRDIRIVLRRRAVQAPAMVVKSDGSLMSLDTALERPIETILSGPAASVAGACRLADVADALIADIGGTTTDCARVEGGQALVCQEGATVGGWRTHVRALDMVTVGLGGDSLVSRVGGRLQIGPRRVAPVAWLGAVQPGTEEAFRWVEEHADAFGDESDGLQFLTLTRRHGELSLTAPERRVVDWLRARPASLEELGRRCGPMGGRFLPLQRLEDAHIVQRCGLTPTDVLHVLGTLALWNTAIAARLCAVYARMSGMAPERFTRTVLQRFEQRLAETLLETRIRSLSIPDAAHGRAGMDGELLDRALAGERDGLHVRLTLRQPVIGIGAPAHCFAPAAARLLNTRCIIPPHADVANAVGAITSSVIVSRQVRIAVDEKGLYTLEGLPGAPVFDDLEQAGRYGTEALARLVRADAARAGTAENRIRIVSDDHVTRLRDGSGLFLGRTLQAQLSGRPDLARLCARDPEPEETAPC